MEEQLDRQDQVKNMNAFNPTPGPDAMSITAVTRSSGKISGYQLSNGQVVDKEQGVRMAKENKLKGVAVATRKGSEFLRALPDDTEDNNLQNLPTIQQ